MFYVQFKGSDEIPVRDLIVPIKLLINTLYLVRSLIYVFFYFFVSENVLYFLINFMKKVEFMDYNRTK